jgi:hypothetical protein
MLELRDCQGVLNSDFYIHIYMYLWRWTGCRKQFRCTGETRTYTQVWYTSPSVGLCTVIDGNDTCITFTKRSWIIFTKRESFSITGIAYVIACCVLCIFCLRHRLLCFMYILLTSSKWIVSVCLSVCVFAILTHLEPSDRPETWHDY